MERVSLGEWGQVQEETNFHWHKRASDESGTPQQRGGILHPHENPGGKSTRRAGSVSNSKFIYFSYWKVFYCNMCARLCAWLCAWSHGLRLALKGMIYHAKIIIILVGDICILTCLQTILTTLDLGDYFWQSSRAVVSGQRKTGFRS